MAHKYLLSLASVGGIRFGIPLSDLSSTSVGRHASSSSVPTSKAAARRAKLTAQTEKRLYDEKQSAKKATAKGVVSMRLAVLRLEKKEGLAYDKAKNATALHAAKFEVST